jgi:hypothetical protein
MASGSYPTDTRTRFENVSPSRQYGDGSTSTVAVVLNWSRFQNVQRIASLLCGSELNSIIKYVLLWNNNPKPVIYLVRDASLYRRDPASTKDFVPTSCSEEKLQIVNPVGNLYFYSRLLGCSQSNAEYCFVQVVHFRVALALLI